MSREKFVWDASALIATVNSRDPNHIECYSFWEDNKEATFLFPAIAWFEFQATQSRALREGKKALRELYILDEKNRVVDIDNQLVGDVAKAGLHERFSKLRGADLIYACIAALEDAPLVTVDKHFARIEGLKVVLLGDAAPVPTMPISIQRGTKTYSGTYQVDRTMVHVTYRGRRTSTQRSPGSSAPLARILLRELVDGFARGRPEGHQILLTPDGSAGSSSG